MVLGDGAVAADRVEHPAQLRLGVAGLLREGALIEISAIAVLPDPPLPLPSGERAG